ncbi:MAG: FAD synthetase family protein [Lachnospiraceae bacterium]|nr:FAD synthetase family protein [Lachnospiraceae bacterium]
MLVIRDIEKFRSEGTAITVGKFDGVHIGHRKIIEILMKEKKDLEACVFTFDIQKDNKILESENRICTESEKEAILEQLGVEKLILFPFNKDTAGIEARDFVKNILFEKLKCRLLVVGDDFKFGKNRNGDIGLLKEMSAELGFKLIVIRREEFEGSPVSSSRIREEIKKQNFDKAGHMLGL